MGGGVGFISELTLRQGSPCINAPGELTPILSHPASGTRIPRHPPAAPPPVTVRRPSGSAVGGRHRAGAYHWCQPDPLALLAPFPALLARIAPVEVSTVLNRHPHAAGLVRPLTAAVFAELLRPP